jgi:hypothetical protein
MHRKRFGAESNLIYRNEPRKSQRVQIGESNGLSKACVMSVTRNYVYQACIETFALVRRQECRGSSTTSSKPPKGLGMWAPAECYAEW